MILLAIDPPDTEVLGPKILYPEWFWGPNTVMLDAWTLRVVVKHPLEGRGDSAAAKDVVDCALLSTASFSSAPGCWVPSVHGRNPA